MLGAYARRSACLAEIMLGRFAWRMCVLQQYSQCIFSSSNTKYVSRFHSILALIINHQKCLAACILSQGSKHIIVLLYFALRRWRWSNSSCMLFLVGLYNTSKYDVKYRTKFVHFSWFSLRRASGRFLYTEIIEGLHHGKWSESEEEHRALSVGSDWLLLPAVADLVCV